ncbi:MAG: PocR ligand-binding domain-containing protein [Actinobacteria bacterium]|nr:PocR ligand-binding domain-containing protein [Actinomycetota bacterium]
MATELRSTEAEANGVVPWTLTDLIDVDTLQSIQDTFARAFKLPTVIVDPDGVNITRITERLSFCEDLTRSSAIGGARCAACDRQAMRAAAESGAPCTFACWNGLHDSAIPISVKGRTIGFFLCGQVLAEPPDAERYRRTAEEIGVDPGAYVAALSDVVVEDLGQYEASVESMHVLAQMIANQAAAAIDNLRTLQEARRARDDATRLVDELDRLFEGLREVASQPSFAATLDVVADALAPLVPWDACALYLAAPDDERLEPVVVRAPAGAPPRSRPRRGEGIVGAVAAGGVARRVVDVRHDPDLRTRDGGRAEPEAALVVPLRHNDAVVGVLALSRFGGKQFSDHELRLLSAFCAQASVSIEVSRLGSENARRLREERAFARLLGVLVVRTQPEAVLAETATVGVELLEADAGVVLGGAGPPAVLARAGISQASAEEVARELEALLPGAPLREPLALPRERGSLLVLPLQAEGERTLAAFVRDDDHVWDLRVAASLATHAALGLDRARMRARERRLLLEYQHLSEIGTELATALNAEEARERLIAKAPAIVGGDACFIALLGAGPDAIPVDVRSARGVERRTVKLEGGGRIATLRLRDEPSDRALFDAWSEELFDAVGEAIGARSFVAEPLSVGSETLGGLFVCWEDAEPPLPPQHSRILSVVATAAAASLARFDASAATDSSLRERVRELEALTQLARRIAGLTHEAPILDELLSAFRRLAALDGAVYGVLDGERIRIRRVAQLDDARAAEVTGAIERWRASAEGLGSALGRDPELVVAPMLTPDGRDAFLAGLGPQGDDEQRDRVVAALAHFGSVALENAHLHDRQRRAISRLERLNVERTQEYDRLQEILAIHETLRLAVVEGGGLGSIVASLQQFVDGEMVVVDAHDRVLASSTGGDAVDWRPEPQDGRTAGWTVVHDGEWQMATAPAVLQGEILAWVVARLSSPPSDVERAAIEYCALLAALELLRDRTELEVETRLRGGFLEDLFREDHVPELLTRQGLVFGFDVQRPSRVLVVEPMTPPRRRGAAAGELVDVERLYAAVGRALRDWDDETLVAIRGSAVVAVVHEPEQPDDEAPVVEQRLLERLQAALPPQSFGIGVGTLCTTLPQYRRSYMAARHGIELLRLLERGDAVFSFRAQTVETMLLESTEPAAARGFVTRYVEPLDAYDSGHSSELRHTLEVWFANAGNLEATARQLHVHVSTLRYRLKKAAELLGVDLRDSREALDVHVALRVAKVLAVHHG